MWKYDKERLREAADCRAVASYIGMRLSGTYCECVSGIHRETQLNHCAIYRHNIHCFSCGDNRDVFGMVMGYYENVLGTPITYQEAFKIVGDACGGADLYRVQVTDTEKPRKPAMPLTEEELSLIGLSSSGSRADCGTVRYVGPVQLFEEAPELFYELVDELIDETMEKISRVLSRLSRTPEAGRLRVILQMRTSKLKKLKARLSAEREKAFSA